MLIRLFYVSTASDLVDDAAVDRIADESAQRNHARKITGALGYTGATFGQVLEGEEDAVLGLLETIRRDDRHSGVIEVGRIKITERAFYDWDMKRLETPTFEELMEVMIEAE